MKLRLVALLLIGLLPLSLQAQTELSLVRLYRLALQNDPDFASARASLQAGLQNRALGRAALLPSLSASIESTRNDYGLRTTTAPFTNYEYSSRVKTIRLTQSIFDLERIAAYGEASAKAELAEAVFAEAEKDLVLRVAQAYFNALLAQDNVELAEAQKLAIDAQRNQAEKLFKDRVSTITDVEETRARHQLAEAQHLVAKSTLEVRRRELAKLMGTNEFRLPPQGKSFPLAAPEPPEIDHWLTAAANQNLRVLSRRINLKIADLQIDRARAGHLPSLNLVASKQKGNHPGYSVLEDDATRVGLQLNIPIFEGGRVLAVTEQYIQEREKARQELEAALRDSDIKVSQAFLGVVNGLSQIKALEQAVKSSETVLKGMDIGQKVGLRTTTDVLNAQQQLFTARRDLQRERYTYLINRLTLEAEVGTLDAADVDFIDALLAASLAATS